jgi:hypothetical protein
VEAVGDHPNGIMLVELSDRDVEVALLDPEGEEVSRSTLKPVKFRG